MQIKIRNGKINWSCLKDKCPKSCCGPLKGNKTQKSFFGMKENNIPLTPNDYKIFVKNGFKKYLKKGKDGGWYIKTKKDGSCPFLKNNKCSIYNMRGSSCKSYPFIFTKYNGLTIDLNCPGWGKGWTSMEEIKKMIKELIMVYNWQIKKTKIKLKIN